MPDYLNSLQQSIKGLRIGLSPDYFRITYMNEDGELMQRDVSDEIRHSVYQTADILRDLGAEIVEDVPMPNTRYGIPAYFVISRVEAASNLHRYDGVKYGYRTPTSNVDLQTLVSKIAR